jgi:hypothetical protein
VERRKYSRRRWPRPARCRRLKKVIVRRSRQPESEYEERWLAGLTAERRFRSGGGRHWRHTSDLSSSATRSGATGRRRACCISSGAVRASARARWWVIGYEFDAETRTGACCVLPAQLDRSRSNMFYVPAPGVMRAAASRVSPDQRQLRKRRPAGSAMVRVRGARQRYSHLRAGRLLFPPCPPKSRRGCAHRPTTSSIVAHRGLPVSATASPTQSATNASLHAVSFTRQPLADPGPSPAPHDRRLSLASPRPLPGTKPGPPRSPADRAG